MVRTAPAPAVPSVEPADRRVRPAVVAWALLIVATSVWGIILTVRDPRITLPGPPLVASFDPRVGPWVLPSLAVGVAAVLRAPVLGEGLTWRRLLWAAFLGTVAWALVLALTDGPSGLLGSVESRYDYRNDLPLIGAPVPFLDTFVEEIEVYTTHVQGHPPGITLVAWSLERVGLPGPWPLAALFVLGGALGVPAVLIALRETAGELAARRAAPFLALAPAAIWVATSGDALFAGVSAWAATLIVLATGRRDGRGDLLAVSGGVLFGVALNLSYGVVLVWAVPALVAAARRRVRPLVLGVAGAAAVLALVAAAGFWWVSGLLATRAVYLEGVARFRPYGYFLVANLAALGIATGPALPAAMSRLRDRGVWLLVCGGLAAVALAELSGLSKAETERIWLPFMPWLLVATAGLPVSRRRAWVAVQVGFGVGLELLLRTPW